MRAAVGDRITIGPYARVAWMRTFVSMDGGKYDSPVTPRDQEYASTSSEPALRVPLSLWYTRHGGSSRPPTPVASRRTGLRRVDATRLKEVSALLDEFATERKIAGAVASVARNVGRLPRAIDSSTRIARLP